MTDTDTPAGLFFELQREIIRETGAMLGRTVELAGDAGGTAPVEDQQALVTETTELARESTHRSLDAIDGVATGGVDELRETVDGTFGALLAQQTRVFETLETRSGDIEDETTATIDEQVEVLLAATEEIEREVTALAEQFVEQTENGELSLSVDELGAVAEQLGGPAGQVTDIGAGFEPIEVTSPDEA